jgi:hypothetical protein
MTSSTSYHLPEELIDLILHFSDRSTLYSLCLASRSLNRIATPHLYTNIALARDDFKHLRPLTLLLWTSPKHRALVRHISVRRAYGGNLVPWPDHPELDSLVERQVKMFVKEEEAARWTRQVRDGNDALPIASLLLRSLPNVSTMGFDGFDLVDPKFRTSGTRC